MIKDNTYTTVGFFLSGYGEDVFNFSRTQKRREFSRRIIKRCDFCIGSIPFLTIEFSCRLPLPHTHTHTKAIKSKKSKFP